MTVWLGKLITCLELETVDLDLLENVDDILSWIALGDDDPSYLSLEQTYGQQILNERFEEFFDRLIVGDLAAGEMFPSSLSEVHAKKRYRQLIRTFHPDRGAKSDVWLNYRAERINKAHQYFLDGIASHEYVASIVDEPAQPDAVRRDVSESKTKFKYRPNVWRERLGSPKEFQRKALSVLVVISLLLVTIIFFGNNQPYDPEKLEASTSLVLTDKKVVSEDKSSVEIYTLNAEAQEILREADELIAQSEIQLSGGDSFNEASVLPVVVDEVQYQGQISTEDPNLKVDEQHSDVGDTLVGCHEYDIQNLKDVRRKKSLLVRLNMRRGPSLRCAVLATMVPGTLLQLDSQTRDGEWTKVINVGESIEGWVDTKMLMSIPEPEVAVEIQAQSRTSSLVKKKTAQQSVVQRSSDVVEAEITASNDVGVQSKSAWTAPEFFEPVEKLKFYYEAGDGESLASLFMSSGRENEIRGADKISKYYRKAFTKIEDRKFKYSIGSYEQVNQSTAVVKGKMYLSFMMRKSLQVISIDANYQIVMVKVAGEYKIVAFDWTLI